MNASASTERLALESLETIERSRSKTIAAAWLSRSSADISTDEKGDD